MMKTRILKKAATVIFGATISLMAPSAFAFFPYWYYVTIAGEAARVPGCINCTINVGKNMSSYPSDAMNSLTMSDPWFFTQMNIINKENGASITWAIRYQEKPISQGGSARLPMMDIFLRQDINPGLTKKFLAFNCASPVTEYSDGLGGVIRYIYINNYGPPSCILYSEQDSFVPPTK
jgi:hypothetical protein